MTTAKTTTDITFLLDRSGSMQHIAEAAVEGFNSFLEKQLQEHDETPARISLVLFNTLYDAKFISVLAPDTPRLSIQSYRPNGKTALLDAIGKTVDETGVRLASMSEEERPGKVIIAILTDGLENASHNYSLKQVSELIGHQREVYKWDFLFLGANQDAIATATELNINRSDAATFEASVDEMAFSMASVTTSISSKKKRMSSEDLSSILERTIKKQTKTKTNPKD